MIAARVILWTDGAHPVPENMARDAELLAQVAAGMLPAPVLRLFTFSPPGVTLGRAQDAERELDLARLRRDGVQWANRPTGGRAIWHDEEWTFSLATPFGVAGWAAAPGAAYQRTAELLAGALRRLGVPAELSAGTPRGPGAPRARDGAAPPCFASSAKHELVLGGRKLAGIAQRAVRGALLQQGSLLLGGSHLRLADYVRATPEQRLRLTALMSAGTTHAGEHLGSDRSLDRFAAALAAEFISPDDIRGEAGARSLGLAAISQR